MDENPLSELTSLLGTMVGIPSVNPRDGALPAEKDLAEFVGDWLGVEGLQVEIEEVLPGRPNVIARLPGRAERTEHALLLETHLDTVEAEGMTVPAFDGVVSGGRMSGRGSCDAKGSLAAFMLAMRSLTRSGFTPPHDVVLAAVMGEEYQALGAAHLMESGLQAAGAVVGEPTGLRAVTASQGVLRFEVRTLGRSAHSSRPDEGVNAIELMTSVIEQLRQVGSTLVDAHPLVGAPSHSITMIRGGSGTNIVPHECVIHVNRRLVPGEVPTAVWETYRSLLEAVNRAPQKSSGRRR